MTSTRPRWRRSRAGLWRTRTGPVPAACAVGPHTSRSRSRACEPPGWHGPTCCARAESHVLVRCDWDDGHRAALRLPRDATGWQSWADTPGGRLLAAYLVGAYRDTVVRLERPPFVEDEHPVQIPRVRLAVSSPSAGCGRWDTCRSGGGRHRGRGPRGGDSGPPVPHAVAWYLRRLRQGYRTGPDALAGAEAVGVTVPAGYTFVGSHVWPRAADPRSPAAELRTTTALSSLRAILQATARPNPGRSSRR